MLERNKQDGGPKQTDLTLKSQMFLPRDIVIIAIKHVITLDIQD
jgi:hypothetical protein